MKAKNILLLIGILLFFAGSVFVLHKLSSALQQKEEHYASLPDFLLPDLNGEMVSGKTIDRNKSTVFSFFNPDCNLCHKMLDSLKTRQQDFSGYQILLVTLQPKEQVKEFLEEIEFRPQENIKILFDENAELVTLMDIKGIPSSLIYKEAKLIKRFDGPVTIEALIKYLQ